MCNALCGSPGTDWFQGKDGKILAPQQAELQLSKLPQDRTLLQTRSVPIVEA
jgi:hypothetical protein